MRRSLEVGVTNLAPRTLIGVRRSLHIVILLAVCGWAPQNPHSPADEARTVAVAMNGTRFVPADVAVSLGETVTWTNQDPFPHNVSSSTGGFSSQDLKPGAAWRFRPKKEGRFPYVCTLHPGMQGTLVVNKGQKPRK
jgi:plastocyanin